MHIPHTSVDNSRGANIVYCDSQKQQFSHGTASIWSACSPIRFSDWVVRARLWLVSVHENRDHALFESQCRSGSGWCILQHFRDEADDGGRQGCDVGACHRADH